MKKIVKILILCLSCIGACWLLPACSSAIEEPESGGGGDGSTVTLKLNAMVPGYETRAGRNEFSPEVEKIDNLRIFVVDKETKEVVYNSNFTNPFQDRDDEFQVTIDVEKNTTQVVYFLANAEEYCEYLPKPGEKYDALGEEKDLYNEIIGIPDPRSNLSTRANSSSERIPYTSKYEIEIEETNVEETCYIAIAAVKFLVKITNKTVNNIIVSSLQIAGTANKSYLFPHLEEGQWDQWINSVIEQDGNYITAYNIPDDATHSPFTLSDEAISINSDETSVIGPAYSHESKLLFASLDPDGDSTEQHYTIQFQIEGTNYHAEIEGLKSLIRSTYIIINININQLEIATDHEIVIWGKIEDWYEEEMEGGLEEVEAPQISLLTY